MSSSTDRLMGILSIANFLNRSGLNVTTANILQVYNSLDLSVSETEVALIVEALQGVDFQEAYERAQQAGSAATVAPSTTESQEESPPEPSEPEEETDLGEGLDSLFG